MKSIAVNVTGVFRRIPDTYGITRCSYFWILTTVAFFGLFSAEASQVSKTMKLVEMPSKRVVALDQAISEIQIMEAAAGAQRGEFETLDSLMMRVSNSQSNDWLNISATHSNFQLSQAT